MKLNKNAEKFIGLIILVIIIIALAWKFNLSQYFQIESVRNSVSAYGIFAPLAFILFYIIATIFFVPGTPLTIASGAIFGTLFGTIYTVIGATIGAILAFLAARIFGRSFIKDLLHNKFKKLESYDSKIEKEGFLVVLILRFIPIFPFNGLNFALGLTKVRFRDYAFGTLVGIIPGSFVLAYFGAAIAELSTLDIILSSLLFILLSLSGKIAKFIKKKLKKIA